MEVAAGASLGGPWSQEFPPSEPWLSQRIAAATGETEAAESARAAQRELAARFEQVAQLLSQLDLVPVWPAANDVECRILLDELVQEVTVWGDHLEVVVHDAARIKVLLTEVRLPAPERIGRVEGPRRRFRRQVTREVSEEGDAPPGPGVARWGRCGRRRRFVVLGSLGCC